MSLACGHLQYLESTIRYIMLRMSGGAEPHFIIISLLTRWVTIKVLRNLAVMGWNISQLLSESRVHPWID